MTGILDRLFLRLRSTVSHLLGFRQRETRERRLDEELQFHVDMLEERNVRAGMEPDAAHRAALVTIGARERFKDEARDEYRSRAVDEIGRDLRYAVRVLRRNRGFTAAVVLTLALGIGALSAVFTVFNAILLKSLPFGAPDRLVQVWSGTGPNVHGPISPANFLDLRSYARSFDAIAGEDFAWFTLAANAGASPERLRGALVSPDFFRVMGVQPALGQGFASDEANTHLVVLSDGLWRRQFAADPGVVGKSILLSGESYVIAGVAAAGFDFPASLINDRIDLWTPLLWAAGQADRGIRELGMTARLKNGVSLAQAQRDLDAIARRLAADYPRMNQDLAIRAVPLIDEIVGSSRKMLRVLLGAMAMVLLIACSNVANLTLARGYAREPELQLRTALGAGSGRIARQLLIESLVLSVAGGTLGLIGAFWLTRVLVAAEPQGLPRLSEIGVDGRVVLFTLLASLLAGLVFGGFPALSASAGRMRAALGGVGRAITEGHDRRRVRSGIVVAQIALALVLLVGAGLLLRSLQRLTSESPGFDSAGVIVARVALEPGRYADSARRSRYISDAVDRLSTVPGVERVGAIDYLPFGRSDAYLNISIEGRPPAKSDEDVAAHLRSVAGTYFPVMRIRLLAGRLFEDADGPSALPVAIINSAMARKYWPNENAAALLGRRVLVGTSESDGPWLTIVGVVGDVKHWNLSEEFAPELYQPQAQSPSMTLNFVVRPDPSRRSPLADAMRDALAATDATQAVSILRLEELVSGSTAQSRFRAILFGFSAALAVVLAVVGIYGVIAYRVSQRTREIGVRLALGAKRSDILMLILRQGIALTVAGVAIGLLASFWVSRLLQGMLFRVTTTDAVTYLGVSILLTVTALLSNLLPARRASRVSPVTAMRVE